MKQMAIKEIIEHKGYYIGMVISSYFGRIYHSSLQAYLCFVKKKSEKKLWSKLNCQLTRAYTRYFRPYVRNALWSKYHIFLTNIKLVRLQRRLIEEGRRKGLLISKGGL